MVNGKVYNILLKVGREWKKIHLGMQELTYEDWNFLGKARKYI